MGRVYFVPGLLGSQLAYRDVEEQPILWADLPRLGLGQLGALGLAENGIDPSENGGAELIVKGVLPRQYGADLALIGERVEKEGDSLVGWGWDWRKDLIPTALRLAEEIVRDNTEAGSVRILCHSAGGLVARLAWSFLEDEGATDLVSRIVTLGTPHYGSYAIVDVWSLRHSSITQLWWLNNVAFGLNAIVPLPGTISWSRENIRNLTYSWPSFYQVLPQVGAPNSESDPWRPAIFEADNWPQDPKPYQNHLTSARTTFLDAISSVFTIPPYEVLTTYIGKNIPTSSELTTTEGLESRAYMQSAGGDNSVTEDSGAIFGRGTWSVEGAHEDLVHIVATSDSLITLLYEDKGSEPEPPVDTDVEGMFNPILRGPPIAGTLDKICAGQCNC